MTIGIILIITGIIFLLKNLGVISIAVWSVIWPGILIVIGVRLLFRRQPWWSDWAGYKEWKKWRKCDRKSDRISNEGEG